MKTHSLDTALQINIIGALQDSVIQLSYYRTNPTSHLIWHWQYFISSGKLQNSIVIIRI